MSKAGPASRTSATFRVEPMTEADWPAVRSIHAEGIATGVATLDPDPAEWATWNATHRTTCRFVARGRDGAVLGWTALSCPPVRKVYAGVASESIYVAERARGEGVGRGLLEHLIRASEAEGIWTLQAGVLTDNAASLALHVRVGFRRIGLQERLGRDPHGRWRDVVLLERRSSITGV